MTREADDDAANRCHLPSHAASHQLVASLRNTTLEFQFPISITLALIQQSYCASLAKYRSFA